MSTQVATSWEPVLEGSTRPRRWLLRGLLVGLVVLVLLAVAAAVVARGATAHSAEHRGRLLPGAVIGGVDVSGMTTAEAVAAVEQVVAPALDHEVVVRWGSRSWTATARELGAWSDAQAVVAEAAAHSARATFADHARMRWQGQTWPFTREVAVAYQLEPVQDVVADIATQVDQEVRDAAIDSSSGWVVFAADRPGFAVRRDEATAAILGALEERTATVRLPVDRIDPATTMADYRQVLLVRQREHRVYLYTDGEITHSWPVAVGTGNHPTPTGVFTVGQKRARPVWINPAPNGWGADMPARIEAGPSNPLGVRALNWYDASGQDTAIRFHGTNAVASIGRDASHGCVRMRNADVIELFDLVDVGATIVSLRA
jgi:lipoprotein-anchoring transpeptidase ErfK/SrfK